MSDHKDHLITEDGLENLESLLLLGPIRTGNFGKSIPISARDEGKFVIRLRDARVISVKTYDPTDDDRQLKMNIAMSNNRLGETEEQSRVIGMIDNFSRAVSRAIVHSPSLRGAFGFTNLKPELVDTMAETLQITLLKPLAEGQVANEKGSDGKFPTRYFTPGVRAEGFSRVTQFWDAEGGEIHTDVIKTWSHGFDCSVIDIDISHVYQGKQGVRKIVCYVSEAVVKSQPMEIGFRVSRLFPNKRIADNKEEEAPSEQSRSEFKRQKVSGDIPTVV